MQLKEILEIENNRTEESRCVIHLFKEGSFYRAYEWSAWLCHRYINQFKVTHRNFKNIEQSVLFVGFPVTSLEKYTSNADVLASDISNNVLDLLLSEETIPADMSLDVMNVDFDSWKQSIPVSEYSPKRKEKDSKESTDDITAKLGTTNSGIIQKILAFPLENSTPIQCMVFISELKQQITSII